jgi:single-strand DNA-binding protein
MIDFQNPGCYGALQEEPPMASVNKVILVGNLGKDPEVRFTPSGRAVAKFPVATTDSWVDQESGRQERTEWHNIVVWGKQAESCGQYLAKGRQVYIEGSIRSRSYDDKDGNKRYITEIVAQRVQFLGGSGGPRPQQYEGGGPSGDFDEFAGGPAPEDDIPF